MKKQCINVVAIVGVVFLVGILLGNIITSRVQDNKFSMELTTQSQSIMSLEKPIAIQHFTEEGATTPSDGKLLEADNAIVAHPEMHNSGGPVNVPTTKEESTSEEVGISEDEVVSEETAIDEETTSLKPIINADSYRCSVDEIYYTHPVREYTEEQKELIAKMLFCEANTTSWDCQVATCSAIINFIEHYGGDFSVLDNYYKFEPAPYYRYKTPSKMNWQVLNYVLDGHLIADVKYFQLYGYHNFGTPMFLIDGVYFSK